MGSGSNSLSVASKLKPSVSHLTMTFGVPELGVRQGVLQARLRICSGG